MKIAFFTEGRFYGKVPANNPNMRTDMAWMHLLNADHFYMYDFSDKIEFDIGIVIVPKNRVDVPIGKIKGCCKKVAIMQEGPCNYWADYILYDQIQHLTLLSQADFILAHNEIDVRYFKGLTGKTAYVMQSVMVESLLENNNYITPFENRNGAIIGGNMCAWYGGMVSFIVASKFDSERLVTVPSMGRKVSHEEKLEGIVHLPYMNWLEWMQALSKFKIGVHLMPTAAAGTFALNCAYLGIPCIGNDRIDTQFICHPELSFNVDDVEAAIEAVENLKDKDFYTLCSAQARKEYNECYHSDIFVDQMNHIFSKELI